MAKKTSVMDTLNNMRTIAFYFLILIVVMLSVWLIMYVKSESYQCILSPNVYGIKLVEKANNSTALCNCISVGPHTDGFMINNTGVYSTTK